MEPGASAVYMLASGTMRTVLPILFLHDIVHSTELSRGPRVCIDTKLSHLTAAARRGGRQKLASGPILESSKRGCRSQEATRSCMSVADTELRCPRFEVCERSRHGVAPACMMACIVSIRLYRDGVVVLVKKGASGLKGGVGYRVRTCRYSACDTK